MEQKQPPNPSQSRDWHFAGIRRQQRPNRKASNFILELKNLYFFLLEQRTPAFGISDFFYRCVAAFPRYRRLLKTIVFSVFANV